MFVIYQKGVPDYSSFSNTECASFTGGCCMKGVCCKSGSTASASNK